MHLKKWSNTLRQNEEKNFKKEICTYSFLSSVDIWCSNILTESVRFLTASRSKPTKKIHFVSVNKNKAPFKSSIARESNFKEQVYIYTIVFLWTKSLWIPTYQHSRSLNQKIIKLTYSCVILLIPLKQTDPHTNGTTILIHLRCALTGSDVVVLKFLSEAREDAVGLVSDGIGKVREVERQHELIRQLPSHVKPHPTHGQMILSGSLGGFVFIWTANSYTSVCRVKGNACKTGFRSFRTTNIIAHR